MRPIYTRRSCDRACHPLVSPQESSDSVCTPHRSGRAFDVAHGYPLAPAFERPLSIPIWRHRDILLLIRRHRSHRYLQFLSSIPEPPLFTTGLTRPRRTLASHVLAAGGTSHFQSVSLQLSRPLSDARTDEIARGKAILGSDLTF